MAKNIKRISAIFLTAVMLFCAASMNSFALTASQLINYLTYDIVDGEVTITGCDSSVSGKITIPDKIDGYPVTHIGEHAFDDNTSLTDVTIPNGVTHIGESAFNKCTSLASIKLPDSVTNIGNYAFYNTNYFNNSKNWVNGVLYIGNHLIKADGGIKGAYAIKKDTKTIADLAFHGCESLASITIPDSVTHIGEGAFYFCKSLTSVTLPNGVKSIGLNAFRECYSLTSVTIPNGVLNIGGAAFSDCKSLSSVTIPESVTNIGGNPFYGCKALTNINVNPNNKNYLSKDGVLFDKAITELIQYPIGNTRTSYVIPNSVKIIDISAFDGCGALTSVTIGSGVTSIGSCAFSSCSKLSSIKMLSECVSVGNYAFSSTTYYNNKNNWENNVLYINNCLISAKDTISGHYNVKENTTSIAAEAFIGCTSLTSVTMPSGLTDIGFGVFNGCKSLTSVNWGDRITSIGKETFAGCNSLKSITIPQGVTSIGKRAFANCYLLESITIPQKVTSIEKDSFENCELLASINVDSNNSAYSSNDGVLFNKAQTKLITYPLGKNVTEYTVPNGVTCIGSNAFYNCTALKAITIPGSVTDIEDSAFYSQWDKLGSLKDVYYDGSNSQWDKIHIDTSNDCLKSAAIHYLKSNPPIVLGDIDENGAINSSDALLALQYSVGKITLGNREYVAADVNDDGDINSSDALIILEYSVGKIDKI